ncbi:hypothetical protein CJU89_0852 [Yarrowia sp. B02]|nr:hypothetical protein CJU89_0852 [Yarrowia sp. B02]
MDWTKAFKISSKPGRPVRLSGAEKTALQAAFDEHAEEGVISAYDVPLVIMELGWSVEEFANTESLDECVEELRPLFLSEVITFDGFSDGFSRMIAREIQKQPNEEGFEEEPEEGGFEEGGFPDDDSEGGFLASDSDEGGFMASDNDEGGGFFVASDGETGNVVEEKPKKKKKTEKFAEDVPLAFSWFTNSDTISTADLRRIAKLVKDNASEKDFKDMMDVAGAVGGKVDVTAFGELLKKL